MEIKSSGSFREFSSGAIRDDGNGEKGRMDLVPLGVVGAIMGDSILINLEVYMRTGNKACLVDIFKRFAIERFGNVETAILEVSKHYSEGSKKYKPRNWERGINLSSYADSAARHYIKVLRGDTDEPHDKAFLWNILGLLWTHGNLHDPEIFDLPFAEKPNVQKERLTHLAKGMSEDDLNEFIGIWNKCHSEGR